MLHIEIELIDS